MFTSVRPVWASKTPEPLPTSAVGLLELEYLTSIAILAPAIFAVRSAASATGFSPSVPPCAT